MNGWLLLDKPEGITSAQAVARVKRKLKPEKIGHGGTLDPLACGLLPLALGEATKTFPYVVTRHKAYRFTVRWGEERATDDREGEVLAHSDFRPSRDDIASILSDYVGDIQQRPPAFSAIKVGGKRSYASARSGDLWNLPERPVQVTNLSIDRHETNATSFTVHCGKGTYVRSLARDMGRALGCYGYAGFLQRISVGPFALKDAISLDMLERMDYQTLLQKHLKPINFALDDIPAIAVDAQAAQCLWQGRKLRHSCQAPAIYCTTETGTPVGMVQGDGEWLTSLRMFTPQS